MALCSLIQIHQVGTSMSAGHGASALQHNAWTSQRDPICMEAPAGPSTLACSASKITAHTQGVAFPGTGRGLLGRQGRSCSADAAVNRSVSSFQAVPSTASQRIPSWGLARACLSGLRL